MEEVVVTSLNIHMDASTNYHRQQWGIRRGRGRHKSESLTCQKMNEVPVDIGPWLLVLWSRYNANAQKSESKEC